MVDASPTELSPLTPGEALAKQLLDNANHGRHAANNALVDELLKRRRAIQALAHPTGKEDPAMKVGPGDEIGVPAVLTSAQLVNAGVRAELLVSLALRRVGGGGVAKWGDAYFDGGRGTPSWLAGVFDELVSTGLLALAEQQDHPGLRVSLTDAGQVRYQQIRTMPVRAAPSEPRDTGPEITGGSPVDSKGPC